jgi:hypothetical protein
VIRTLSGEASANSAAMVAEGDAVILITGSRDWKDRTFLYSALDRARTLYPGRRVVVRHGAARGADTLASNWVDSIGNHRLVDEDPIPADGFGPWPAAGMIRNAHMVRKGALWCLAFINRCSRPKCAGREVHGSHGAEGCLEMAERAGMPFRAWRTF